MPNASRAPTIRGDQRHGPHPQPAVEAGAPDESALPAIPAAACAQMWLDFDGTLTCSDLLDDLICRYSRNDSWRLIEERWRSGQIGSRDCLEQEFALLRMTPAQVSAELARVRLDPGAARLLALFRSRHVPVTIVSDGIESFIRSILASHQIEAPAVRANVVRHTGTTLTLGCPHSSAACTSASAHCKCASRRDGLQPGRVSIYVGDGRSDLCASQRCEVIFAKGALAEALGALGVAFRPFRTLLDVHDELIRVWTSADAIAGIPPSPGHAPLQARPA